MKTVTLIAISLMFCVAASAFASDQPSEQELKQANNPLADMRAFNVQNYYMPDLLGFPDATANTAWLRYVHPFGRWVTRTSLPLKNVPTAGDEYESGLGNLNLFAAYLVTPPDKGVQFGVGPLAALPTATDDALGADKWDLGAAAVFFNLKSPQLQYGGLVTYQASVAGDDDLPDSSLMVLQPFAMWQLGKGTYLRSAPIWAFDFENDRYLVPVGFGIGKIMKVGNTVFNIFVEPQFTVLSKGNGVPSLQLFAGLNMQFLPKQKE